MCITLYTQNDKGINQINQQFCWNNEFYYQLCVSKTQLYNPFMTSRKQVSVKLMTHTPEIGDLVRKKIGAENQHGRRKNWQQTIKSPNYTNKVKTMASTSGLLWTSIQVLWSVMRATRISSWVNLNVSGKPSEGQRTNCWIRAPQ